MIDDLLRFLGESPTPYHAVHAAIARLQAAGFVRLDERSSWSELAPGSYYVTQGDSTLCAFVLPRETLGFRIVGAHTDSPNLRLKPRAPYAHEGYLQLGVEVYGGVLLNSWLDRDLALAGRLLAREADGTIGSHLVRLDRPLARIPQLAIHLDREVNEHGLVLNRQEHLAPVWALDDTAKPEELLELCAREIDIAPASVVGADLMLYDHAPPMVAGRRGEFLFAARLDDLAMCHAALAALALAAPSAREGELVALVALVDHEEVGSQSALGASSAFLPRLLERIASARGGGREAFLRALSGSVCISADMAHAVHPNYAERHEPRHRPAINGGPVLKMNAQQRYATSARGAALFRSWCKTADVPCQIYVHRTDLPCGSTIGPITSALLGVETIDIGNAMLSMHSAREMAGTADPALMGRVLTHFLSGAAT